MRGIHLPNLFAELPWPIRWALIGGGTLVTAAYSRLPDAWQDVGLYCGVAILAYGVLATIWHHVKLWHQRQVNRSMAGMASGLFITACFGVAIVAAAIGGYSLALRSITPKAAPSASAPLIWLLPKLAAEKFASGNGDVAERLRQQLLAGSLIARGTPHYGKAGDPAVVIPAAEWQSLKLGGKDFSDAASSTGPAHSYDNLEITATDGALSLPAKSEIFRPYLKEAYVYSASMSSDPYFSAKFARSGARGRLYVDDSHYFGNFGSSFWTKRQRIAIAQPINDFVAEQSINVPILTSVHGIVDDGKPAPSRMWRWGDGKTNPQVVFNQAVQHQCRIVFISDDAPPEYFYFVVFISPPDGPLNVIGMQNFDFVKEWEADDAKEK